RSRPRRSCRSMLRLGGGEPSRCEEEKRMHAHRQAGSVRKSLRCSGSWPGALRPHTSEGPMLLRAISTPRSPGVAAIRCRLFAELPAEAISALRHTVGHGTLVQCLAIVSGCIQLSV